MFNVVLFFNRDDVQQYDYTMVLIVDGNSDHVAHAWTKIGLFGGENPICDGSCTNQMP